MNQLAVPADQGIRQTGETPGWLVLSVATLKLAVPQKDVEMIELLSKLDVAVDGEVEAGWLEHEGEIWPVYNVDGELRLQTDLARARRFCIMLRSEERLIGLVCDQVQLLPSDSDLDLIELAGCLVNADSPLKWFALLEGRLVVVAKSGAVASYLTALETRHATG